MPEIPRSAPPWGLKLWCVKSGACQGHSRTGLALMGCSHLWASVSPSVSGDKKGGDLGVKDLLGSVPHSANTCQAPIPTRGRGGGGAEVGMSHVSFPRQGCGLRGKATGHMSWGRWSVEAWPPAPCLEGSPQDTAAQEGARAFPQSRLGSRRWSCPFPDEVRCGVGRLLEVTSRWAAPKSLTSRLLRYPQAPWPVPGAIWSPQSPLAVTWGSVLRSSSCPGAQWKSQRGWERWLHPLCSGTWHDSSKDRPQGTGEGTAGETKPG